MEISHKQIQYYFIAHELSFWQLIIIFSFLHLAGPAEQILVHLL